MRTLQCFQKNNLAPENMKKPPSKVAHNWPKIIFSVLPTSPKPAQISAIFHRNLPQCDFSIMTLAIHIAFVVRQAKHIG